MPANSLDAIIWVSTCNVRSKLNHLFACFLEICGIGTVCHNTPPFFTLRNKSHFLLREFYGWDRSCPHAIQRKKETGVCIPISKHHICLQQGAVFQSNHARNSVIIVLLFQNIPVAWAVWGLKCATLTSVPQLPWLQVSWAFLLSIGFHTDILPLTSIKPLSHNMLPHSASWFVFK